MATISVGGYSFNIRPETAAWSYAMKIQSFDTYDGRVIQLLACNIESLSVEGYILPKYKNHHQVDMGGGRSDVALQWQGMEEFEWSVKKIMAAHEESKSPAHLTFDSGELDWDCQVYLVGYTDVRYEPDIPAARYTLKFQVDSGAESIAAAASDEGLKNVPDGVGWVRNIYNTPRPESWEKVKDAIGKIVDDAGTHDTSKPADFYTYLKEAFDEGSDEEGAKEGKDDGSYVEQLEKGVNTVLQESIDNVLVSLGVVPASKDS